MSNVSPPGRVSAPSRANRFAPSAFLGRSPSSGGGSSCNESANKSSNGISNTDRPCDASRLASAASFGRKALSGSVGASLWVSKKNEGPLDAVHQASYYLQQPRCVHRPTMRLTSAFVAEQLSAAFDVYDPDLVVSVHPLMQLVPLRVLRRRAAARAKAQATAVARSGDFSALGRARAAAGTSSSHHHKNVNLRFDDHHVRDPGQPPPFATVVTDLTTCHNTWFDPRVDACFVPTEECAARARKLGVPPEKVIVHGLPIRPGFARPQASKKFLRRKLGMDPEMPAVLLVGMSFVFVFWFSFFLFLSTGGGGDLSHALSTCTPPPQKKNF